jgi:hypothetical protein
MNINVHIERLILDGLPVDGRQGSVLKAGVEAELVRLLGEKGLSGISATMVERLSGGMIQLTGKSRPADLGQQIAQSIYTAMEPNRMANQSRSHRGGSRRK